MPIFNYIYCNKCDSFHFVPGFDFGDGKKTCPLCFTKNIKEFKSNSFAEMAQVERKMKINKIINK